MRVRRLGLIPSFPLHDDRSVAVQRIGRTAVTDLKVVTIAAGAATDLRRHDHRHHVVVVEGRGRVGNPSGERLIDLDDVVATAPWEWHTFAAGPDERLRFVCLDSHGNRRAVPERHQTQNTTAGEANR